MENTSMVATRKKKQRGLTASIKKETSSVKINIDKNVLENAKAYSKFIGITSIDEAIEKALEYVMEDDQNWNLNKKDKSA